MQSPICTIGLIKITVVEFLSQDLVTTGEREIFPSPQEISRGGRPRGSRRRLGGVSPSLPLLLPFTLGLGTLVTDTNKGEEKMSETCDPLQSPVYAGQLPAT